MNDRNGHRRDRADGDRESEMRIKDPEKYHKTQRLKQIHEAKAKFTTVYRKVEAENHKNGREAVAAVALDLVRQLEPLIEKSESDLLDKTVKVGGKGVTIRQLLDQGGTVTTTKRVVRGRSPFPENDTETNYMNKATSLEVVRMCDHWLDEYIDFDIEDADADSFHIG